MSRVGGGKERESKSVKIAKQGKGKCSEINANVAVNVSVLTQSLGKRKENI